MLTLHGLVTEIEVIYPPVEAYVHEREAADGVTCEQVSVPGVNEKLVGNPISIIAAEGRSDPGINPIVSVVFANTIAEATSTALTVTATPCKLGVGFNPVKAPSIG